MAKVKQAPPQEGKEVAKFEPNTKEQAFIAKHKERAKNTPPAPQIKMVDGRMDIAHPEPGHGWCILMEALGTTSIPFAVQIQNQLLGSLTIGKEPDPAAVNFGLAVIAAVKPRDELETMLAAQMAAIHCTTMTFARRLNHVENIPQQDSAERTLNKLARTFAVQLEALKKYRGAEQKITVQHVTVNEGGQAIVGTVEQRNDRGEG